MIAGVAGGLAEYFVIDPALVRLLFVLLTVFGGTGILIYIILWIVVPSEGGTDQSDAETIKNNAKEFEERARSFARDAELVANKSQSHTWFGIIILLLGLSLLLSNFELIRFSLIWDFWPLILIVLGIMILAKGGRGK